MPVCVADPFFVRLIFGLFKPRQPVLGMTVAGEVEQVGKNVSLFRKGDQVFGSTEMRMGAMPNMSVCRKALPCFKAGELDF
ncbi:alcohol dehydrogenase catalytic domain-containing protein [Geofilum rubicundum]|uniref:alcohol dehydrogenase catalytic domain-containing protein n=1 Tax=Geofilum rubicundum TaxID=472113 RepID=UPI00269D3A0E